LKQATLVDAVERITGVVDDIEQKALKTLRDLLSAGKHWSKFVDDAWNRSQLRSSEVSLLREVERCSDRFTKYLCRHNTSGTEHFVTVFDDRDMHPTCSCGYYLSKKIPCEGICCVFNNQKGKGPLFDVKNLPFRWRLCSHPLYDVAQTQLGIRNEITAPAHAPPSSMETFFGVPKDVFNKVSYPKTDKSRYAQLYTIFKNNIIPRVKTQATYKWAVCMLSKMSNMLEQMTLASQGGESFDIDSDVPCVLPPVQRKKSKRVTESDLVNAAAIKSAVL